MRQGFEFNSQGERNAFKVRVEGVAKSKFKGHTNTYGVDLKHPTLNKWGYEVQVDGSDAWILIEEELNPNDINNLITFDSSWFPDEQT